MAEATIPRMRTAAKDVAEIKALDPDSDVTDYCIRKMVRDGVVSAVWAGNKALINLDDVLGILRVGTKPPPEPEPVIGSGIRKIKV